MKKLVEILLAAATATALAASCNKAVEIPEQPEQPAEAELITIHAAIPEGTKVAFSEGEVSGIHLEWEDTDCLLVCSGSEAELFEIQDDFTEHEATFTGSAVSGSSFDILYPGDEFESLDEIKDYDFSNQVQNGNDDMSHLRYIVWLEGVDSYTSFTFSDEWALAHGGIFNVPAYIKVEATLPSGVTKVKGVTITVGDDKYSLGLKNIDVSKSSQKLIAYMMTPWEGVGIAPGVPVEVAITDNDDQEYVKSFSIATGSAFKPGHVSVIKLPKGLEPRKFAGGSGTAAAPYLIATAGQMMNMHDVMADGQVVYFKMIADVDMTGKDWVSLNGGGDYSKGINFDGDGHIISNLHASSGDGKPYPSFAGVLNGTIKNVTFDSAVISGGSNNVGVVAGYIGTSSINGFCNGVTVKDASVTVKATQKERNAGAFAGVLAGAGSEIDGCHVTGNTVVKQEETTYNGCCAAGFIGAVKADCIIKDCSSKADIANPSSYYTGGFIGNISAGKSEIIGCSYKGGIITAGRVAVANSPVGGFLGRVANNLSATFDNCYCDGAQITAVSSGRVGGFVGEGGKTNAFTCCYVKNSSISGAQHSAGFGGVFYGIASKCYVESTSLTANDINNGGFAGYFENSTISDCYAVVSISGDAFTNTGGFIGNCRGGNTATNCYESSTVSGTAAGVGAFIGGVTAAGASVTKCVAWDGALSFIGDDGGLDVSGITGNYCGTDGTISSQAQAFGWSTGTWDFSSAQPKLK